MKMKTMKRKLWINTILSLIVLLMMMLPSISYAQIIGGGCDPLDPRCPIDGGLSALLAIGAGYGIKKIRDARKAVDPEQ